MMDATVPSIAIVGGGLGGLTCAGALRARGIGSVVFEQEMSAGVRSQGGTLDMRADSGQVALRAVGVAEQFTANARYEGQDMQLRDRTGAVLFANVADAEDAYCPEMDRGDIRAMLLDALAPGTVRWGRLIREIRPVAGGRHELVFDDGTAEAFDLVVGADGAWSRVRPLLSSAQPEYTGVTFVEIDVEDVDVAHPAVARTVGNGSMFALSDNKGLIAQRTSGDRIRVYVALRKPEAWVHEGGVDFSDPHATRAVLLEEFADWAPELRALLVECADSFITRHVRALPVPHTWSHRPGVTLLGDAAHLMSPFSGVGANLAMLDAAELAEAISTASDLDTAVREYETAMLPRAAEAARDSAQGLEDAIASDAPRPSFVATLNPAATA